jgi:two-component system OmpR family response regulator
LQGSGVQHMKKILIVEDHPYLSPMYSRMLTKRGYIADFVTSGEMCLSYLEEKTPDLILLDIMMDPMNGWEVLTRIRNNPGTRNIPVIIVTAKPPMIKDVKMYGKMIDGFRMKPFTSGELADLVDRFFSERVEIEKIVQNARKSGKNPRNVEEYRSLAMREQVDSDLLTLLKTLYSYDDAELQEEVLRHSQLKQHIQALLS